LSAAVTFAVPALVIVPAVALKVPVVSPAATTRETGTVTMALLSDRLTRLPPAGAATLSVTVQVLAPPDTTLEGAQSRDDTCARALRLIDAVTEPDP
jgi:hypothetical protein